MKHFMTTALAAVILLPSLNAESDSNAVNVINTALQKIETPSDAPDWVKRTSIKLQVEEGYRPMYELETIQPIYQSSENDMLFWQFDTSYINTINTYNLGVGYRNIINPELMLGVNAFYDYQQDNHLKRGGIGIEAIGNYLEFRANRYLAISNKKEVEPNVFEEVLDGYDAEIGGLIPKTKLRVYASYTRWQAVSAPKDLIQEAVRVEYPINRSLLLDVKYTSDNEKQGALDQHRVSANLTMTFGAKTKSSKNRVISDSLQDRLLIPVQRENQIITERTVSAKITIKRGT